MSPFDCLSPERIVSHIQCARDLVVFSATSLTDSIATALIDTARNIGHHRVIILLDTSEEVLRMGYGDVMGIKNLLAEPGMILRKADGLRINVLV